MASNILAGIPSTFNELLFFMALIVSLAALSALIVIKGKFAIMDPAL
ncbi:MAG TPA: hypothetical protein VNJ08_01240 [Bacteriovoracaceae bacterium]|nr:hypothetical protein [Bacteriovoracaceae bacterium]